MTFTPGQYGHLAEHDALRLAIDTADATTAARVTDTGTATGAAVAGLIAAVIQLDVDDVPYFTIPE